MDYVIGQRTGTPGPHDPSTQRYPWLRFTWTSPHRDPPVADLAAGWRGGEKHEIYVATEGPIAPLQIRYCPQPFWKASCSAVQLKGLYFHQDIIYII